MKRLFIAVDLADAVAERLAELQQTLADRIEDDVRLTWTPPENMHLTVKFVGATEESEIPALCRVIEDVSEETSPFEIESRGIGCFPRPDKPRVIWAGIDDEGAGLLSQIHRALERDLADLDVPKDDRAYKPHLTLGRVKSRVKPSVDELFQGLRGRSWGTTSVAEIVLYESQLDHTGARYEAIDRFPLSS
jgi:2'-5' RNA ligase